MCYSFSPPFEFSNWFMFMPVFISIEVSSEIIWLPNEELSLIYHYSHIHIFKNKCVYLLRKVLDQKMVWLGFSSKAIYKWHWGHNSWKPSPKVENFKARLCLAAKQVHCSLVLTIQIQKQGYIWEYDIQIEKYLREIMTIIEIQMKLLSEIWSIVWEFCL